MPQQAADFGAASVILNRMFSLPDTRFSSVRRSVHPGPFGVNL